MGDSRATDAFSVEGKRIVIVGGTAGIGLAVAAHLSECGATVFITGRRNDGEAVANAIGAQFVRMDVADDVSVSSGFEAIAALTDQIDCLILNAGIEASTGEVGQLDLAVFEQILDVNTMGVVRALNRGIAAVREGGSIVVTSSPAGSLAVSGMAAYSASKAAVDILVKTWALELGPRQIRVNAVLPGIVESEMGSAASPDLELIRRMTANGIYRKAAEMGPVFQFLASDASGPLTGSLVGAHDGISIGYSNDVMRHLAADLEDS